MFHRYSYEAEFYADLKRVPLDVRRKLDLTGIKISLKDWLALSFEERTVLCHLPCENREEQEVFFSYMNFLARRYSGKPLEKTDSISSEEWSEASVPEAVATKSADLNIPVTLDEWRHFPSHRRYALYKTAVSKSQPEAFEQVLREIRSQMTPA